MAKKLRFLVVIALLVLSLAACGKTKSTTTTTTNAKREFVRDGEFSAIKASLNSGAPQYTIVTVKIENDKVVSYYINCLQSTKTTTEGKASYSFNNLTKKELGYAYHMHYNTYKATLGENPTEAQLSDTAYAAWLKANNKLEWFEQAQKLEAFFLEKGPDKLEVATDSKISGVAGVTIKNADYKELAVEALANAKAGKVVFALGDGTDLIWAEGKVDKNGNLSDVKLNTLQGKVQEDNTFKWNEKNKQELGYAYHMHYNSFKASLGENPTEAQLSDTAYAAWLKANNKLEWFEQAAIVVEKFMATGTADLPLNGTKLTDAAKAATGVTINVSKYIAALQGLKAAVK